MTTIPVLLFLLLLVVVSGLELYRRRDQLSTKMEFDRCRCFVSQRSKSTAARTQRQRNV